MSRTRYAMLPLALGLLAGTACSWDLTGSQDVCLHSEGCGGGGGIGGGWDFRLPLVFSGLVTSATTGKSVAGVTVRIEAPARAWSETVLTDSTGRYVTTGLPGPVAGDCAGLSVSFSRDGYQPLRVVDFPLLTCGPGYADVSVSLMAAP
jgi:hypothetical protein